VALTSYFSFLSSLDVSDGKTAFQQGHFFFAAICCIVASTGPGLIFPQELVYESTFSLSLSALVLSLAVAIRRFNPCSTCNTSVFRLFFANHPFSCKVPLVKLRLFSRFLRPSSLAPGGPPQFLVPEGSISPPQPPPSRIPRVSALHRCPFDC